MAVVGVAGGGAALGAAAAYAGRDKQKNLTSTQTSEPWSAQIPYLTYGFSEARNLYDQSKDQGYYPNQTYASPSESTLVGLQRQQDRATNGSALFNAAKDQNLKTINGDYLNASSNPYLQDAIGVANQGVIKGFNNSVIPQLQSSFSSAGRYGSGLQNQAQNDASYTLANQLGNNATNLSYNNYNAERDRQNNAVANAPAYAQADYNDIANLLDVGQQREAITQQGIDDSMNRYNYNRDQPWTNLENYTGLVNGNYGGTTTSTERNPNYKSASSALLGGGLAGAGMGTSLLGSYGQYNKNQAQANYYNRQT